MPTVGFSLASEGAQEFRDLAKRLRKSPELRKRLRKNIQAAGRPVVNDVRTAVKTVRVKSTRGGGSKSRRDYNVERASTGQAEAYALRRGAGLRDTVARATKLELTNRGVRIVVRGSALPDDQRSLPRHLDSEKGWRHPVFGNREEWVTQRGTPWFAVTIQKKARTFRKAVLDAMEETKRGLEKR